MSKKPLFDLGPIVATPGALELLEKNNVNPAEFITRHVTGDFGAVGKEDWQANLDAIVSGARILSVYFLPDENRLWIITDAEVDEQHHRYCTTLLRPQDY